MQPLVISVSGLARSGKSTFCDLVSKELTSRFKLKCCQLSFATPIRVDTQDFLARCGFDVWSSVNKERFRPVLIWYASLKRKQTNGRYFIEKLKQDLEIKSAGGQYNIFLISDLRFAEYSPNDEIDYCLDVGPVVHISKYQLVPYNMIGDCVDYSDLIRQFDIPPNEFEAKNDPLIKEKSNYRIEWEDQDRRTENLKHYITEFIDWLDQNYLSKSNPSP